jgi:arylsulfatase A
MLGKHAGNSPIRGNPAWTVSGNAADFALSDVTVAEELKRANYTTGVIGKWGYGQDGKSSFPLKQGFDYFYGFADHRAAHHYYPEKIWVNNKEVDIPENIPNGENKGLYIHDEFTRKAKEFIVGDL